MTTIKDDDILLSRKEAARYIGMKANTLAKWECYGDFRLEPIRVGRNRIRYRRSALDAYLSRNLITGSKSQ